MRCAASVRGWKWGKRKRNNDLCHFKIFSPAVQQNWLAGVRIDVIFFESTFNECLFVSSLHVNLVLIWSYLHYFLWWEMPHSKLIRSKCRFSGRSWPQVRNKGSPEGKLWRLIVRDCNVKMIWSLWWSTTLWQERKQNCSVLISALGGGESLASGWARLLLSGKYHVNFLHTWTKTRPSKTKFYRNPCSSSVNIQFLDLNFSLWYALCTKIDTVWYSFSYSL